MTMTTYYDKIHSPTTTHSISFKQIPIYLLIELLNNFYDLEGQIYTMSNIQRGYQIYFLLIDGIDRFL